MEKEMKTFNQYGKKVADMDMEMKAFISEPSGWADQPNLQPMEVYPDNGMKYWGFQPAEVTGRQLGGGTCEYIQKKERGRGQETEV